MRLRGRGRIFGLFLVGGGSVVRMLFVCVIVGLLCDEDVGELKCEVCVCRVSVVLGERGGRSREEVVGRSVCVSLGALLRGYFLGIEAASLSYWRKRACVPVSE